MCFGFGSMIRGFGRLAQNLRVACHRWLVGGEMIAIVGIWSAQLLPPPHPPPPFHGRAFCRGLCCNCPEELVAYRMTVENAM